MQSKLYLKTIKKLLQQNDIPERKIPTAVIGIAAHQGKPVVLWKFSSKLMVPPMGPVRSTASDAKLEEEPELSASCASSWLAGASAAASEPGLVRSVSAASGLVDEIQAD